MKTKADVMRLQGKEYLGLPKVEKKKRVLPLAFVSATGAPGD